MPPFCETLDEPLRYDNTPTYVQPTSEQKLLRFPAMRLFRDVSIIFALATFVTAIPVPTDGRSSENS